MNTDHEHAAASGGAKPGSAGDDEGAFRQLFTDTYPALVAYARRRCIDVSEADDIVSEVYATAWRRRADRDAEALALPWLYGIATNVMRNQWRASSRRLQLVERLEAQPAREPSGDPGDREGEELRSALERLSFDDQEVLRLVAWEGLSHREVAAVLSCSTNAVGVRIHRARQRLEQELQAGEAEQTRQPRAEINDPGRRGGAAS